MMDKEEMERQARQLVQDLAQATIQAADIYGLVVKIETVPKTPLAMGHYEMRAQVYPRSRKARC